jgi:hypothetical protein
VVISCGAEVIARHPRSYEREDFVFNPLHYLALLEHNEPAFPSRPGIPCHGARRSGWEERSHAQHREHGEHRTFPAVSTVAG